MDKLIVALLTWISLQIGVEMPQPPRVRLVTQRELVELAYGKSAPEGVSVKAMYQRKSKTVHLSEAWRPDSLEDRGILLHELVHHVQEVAGLSYPCIAAREALAYHLQAQWLKENGVDDPYALMDVDEFTIAVRSMCPESE